MISSLGELREYRLELQSTLIRVGTQEKPEQGSGNRAKVLGRFLPTGRGHKQRYLLRLDY